MSAKIVLAIGLFSGIGGIARYLASIWIQQACRSTFPWGTWCVNITGCLLIGFIYTLSERSALTNEWKIILSAGLMGGFTTFSAFSMETIQLIRQQQWMLAAGYVMISILVGLLAVMTGSTAAKWC